MTTQPTNQAIWLPEKQAYPFTIGPAPMPTPVADEVVISVRATAINPADAAIQKIGIIVEKYPATIGCDVAGVITALGPDANSARSAYGDPDLAVGDRVIAGVFDTYESRNGAFQHYTVAAATQVALLPARIGFADGAVLPLAFGTAASSLFDEKQMGLALPQLDVRPQHRTVLIWGAASSVGACAVQLAKAAGYTVAATASKPNLELCKSLGADFAFDYKEDGVVGRIVEALKGEGEFAGAYDAVIPMETMVACAEVAKALGGAQVVGTVFPPYMPLPEGLPEGIRFAFSWGSMRNVAPWTVAVWGKWTTAALESGALKCLPEKLVVGKGLESVQKAVDRYNEGISGRKVVVEFDWTD